MSRVHIRPYHPGEEAALSALICAALRTHCSRDYPPDVIAWMVGRHQPAQLPALAAEGRMLVAETAGRPVGVLRLLAEGAGGQLCTVYVHPAYAGQGVGRLLVQQAEAQARALGYLRISLGAAANARGFYERLGYRYDGPPTPDAHGLYRMQKELFPR